MKKCPNCQSEQVAIIESTVSRAYFDQNKDNTVVYCKNIDNSVEGLRCYDCDYEYDLKEHTIVF